MIKQALKFIAPGGLAAQLVLLASAQSGPSPQNDAASSSLMAAPSTRSSAAAAPQSAHALRAASMFAITPPEARQFAVHDLVQILVRETSAAVSSQALETDKNYEIDATVPDYKDFWSMLTLGIANGDGETSPQIQFDIDKSFEGEGDYERTDDMTARVTAEVIEILPNGNLILEARSEVKTDDERTVISVTGICRPGDVTPANTILSNQIHDLKIEKMNTGELKKAGEKGIISKVLDMIFAF
jgi:flagellar L-ring protein precursor FlgH